MYLAVTPNDLITIQGSYQFNVWVVAPFQCGYTETSIAYACPHWRLPTMIPDTTWQLIIHVFTFSFEIYRCQALTY
jgi:hypothetical protein